MYVDSCASNHCTGSKENVLEEKEATGACTFGDGTSGCPITHTLKRKFGVVDKRGTKRVLIFSGMQYASCLTKTLLSMGKLCEQGFKFNLNNPNDMYMTLPSKDWVIMIPLRWVNNLLAFDLHFG